LIAAVVQKASKNSFEFG